MSGRVRDRGGLSPGARALLEAAREADAPTRADRERVRRAVALAVAGSAGAAGVASAGAGAKAVAGTGASAATAIGGGVASTAATGVAAGATASLFAKLAIAAVAIGVGSTAVVAVHHYASTDAEPAARDSSTSSIAAPAIIAAGGADAPSVAPDPGSDLVTGTEAATAPPLADPISPADSIADPPAAPAAPAPVAAAPRRARAARPARAPEDVSTLDAEMRVLRDASRPGAPPAQRLASVDAHAAQFPDGVLAGERERALRSAARDLCAEGDDAVARYLDAHPASTSAARLRATCAPR